MFLLLNYDVLSARMFDDRGRHLCMLLSFLNTHFCPLIFAVKPRLCPCHKEICRKRAAPSQFQPDLLQVIPRNSTGKYHRRQCTAWSEGTLVTVGITAISVSACCLLVAAVVVADVRVMVRDFRARRAKGAVDTAGSTRRNQRKVC